MTRKSQARTQRDKKGVATLQRSPVLEAPKLGLFFHLNRLWLCMAYAGSMGDQNQIKARYHAQQWIEYRKAQLAMQGKLVQGDEVAITAVNSKE